MNALRPAKLTRIATVSSTLAMLLSLPLASASSQTTGTPPPPLDPTYTPTMTFDIASIRESGPIVNGQLKVTTTSPVHASRFEVTNFTGKSLIQMGYGFGTPISGEPAWFTEKYFNVLAKSDPAADAKLAKLTDDQGRMEKQHMVQALLTERLALKAHWENRETAVYALVIGKNGSKLKEVKPETADSGDPNQPKPALPSGTEVKATGSMHGLEFDAQSSNTRAIAAMIVSQIGTPVIDRTGLTGSYAFVLQFGRDWSAHDPDSWPDIFAAVQEQLGLKLESTKALVPVLVIDHVELPSAN